MVEQTEIIVNHEAHIGYSTRTESIVSFAQQKAEPQPTASTDEETSTEQVAAWGASNDFPQIIEREIMKNPDLAAALDWKARALYAGGLTYKVMKADADGNATYVDSVIPEIEAWQKRNLQYRITAPHHFYKFYNTFTEMVLSLDRSQVLFLKAQDPKKCRFGIQNPKTLLIDKVYISSRWAAGATPADKANVKPLPVIDPTLWTPEMVKMRTDGLNYIFPISYPTGNDYYQLAHWDSIRQSKWFELANSIPQFKIALMKNQLTIKYHIQMPDYWMEWKYPGFKGLKPDKQKALTTAELQKFDDFLVGSKNAGKSLTSVFRTDPNMKAYPGWSITAIDDKLKDGAYLEDSLEATIKIFSAVGVDPSLAGITPGKSGTNRNGSDKREALNIYLSFCQMHEDLLLQPYDFVSEYNGWNKKYGQIVWSFIKPYMQTLNQVTPSQRETTPSDAADIQ
ncbi:hypothetical protein [Rufibacter soli]